MTEPTQSQLLLRALRGNGVFSTVLGLGFLLGLVFGFLAGAFVAAFYNMAARTTGGLRIRIRESEDT